MPDEQQIEPSETGQSAPPEHSAPAEQAAQPESSAQPQTEPSAQSGQPAPNGAGPEPASSPPDEAPPDDAGGDESVGDGPGGDRAGGGEGDDGADPRAAALEEAVRERDAHYDRLLRLTAEFDNYRKRTERERRELIDQAAGDLLGDLLPVVDDLERALAADARDGDAYRRGVEIIHRQLLDVMARRGVAPIEAAGADFDPTLHQAVAHEPGDGHRDGEVVEELRRGYTLRGRLLRPSMVKVAKA